MEEQQFRVIQKANFFSPINKNLSNYQIVMSSDGILHYYLCQTNINTTEEHLNEK